MRLVEIAICLVLAAALAGCGFQPLYGTSGSGQEVSTQLSSISEAETDTRVGQLVRNNLLSAMRPAGAAGEDLFHLTFTPSVTKSLLAEASLPDIKRQSLRLSVAFSLTENSTGKELMAGKTFSNVSYDLVEEPIADLEAETNATSKAAQEVGQDIRIRLAAYLAKR